MPNFRDIVAATPQGQRLSGPTMNELKLKDEAEKRARQSAERNAILEMLTNQGKQISNRSAQISNRTADLANTQKAREMARYGNQTFERATINGQEVVITKDGNGRPIATDSLYAFMQKNKRQPSSAAAPVQNLPIFQSQPPQARPTPPVQRSPVAGPRPQQSQPNPRPQWAQKALNPAQERLAPYLPVGLDPYQATDGDWVKASAALKSGKRSGGRYTGYDPKTGRAFDTETNQVVMMPESEQVESQRHEEKEAALAFIDAKIASKDDLLDTIEKAQGILSKDQNTLITTTAGLTGIVGFLPQTDGFDLQAKIDTIEANLAFDRLDEMRAASKTGGALGAVSEKELLLLKSSITSLNRLQSAGELANGLEKVYTHYSRFIDALAAARQKQIGVINPAATPAAAQEELVYNPSTKKLEPK